MNHLNRVSILVTCFNKYAFIESFSKQLESVLRFSPEIIIVDDFSNDGSREELKLLAQKSSNICLTLNDKNFGSAFSRNLALQKATKDWVFFWDIDDRVDFSVLDKMVQQATLEEVEICRGRYSILSSEKVSLESKSEEASKIYSLSHFAETITNEMGYWRFLYSRSFLHDNGIIFAPTFSDVNSKFFILDDVFFLILVASADGQISICANADSVYYYNQTYHDVLSWQRFQKQAAIFAEASIFILAYVKRNNKLNYNLAYQLTLEKAMAHMLYLNLSNWISCIGNFVRLFSLGGRKMSAKQKIEIVLVTFKRSMKNSVMARFYKTS